MLAAADRLLSRAEEIFVGAAMAFSAVLLFVNVVLRYWFLSPIAWAEELSLYLVVWMVFVGASVATRTRGHIAIDLLPLWPSTPDPPPPSFPSRCPASHRSPLLLPARPPGSPARPRLSP